jgi:hypothetical protein
MPRAGDQDLETALRAAQAGDEEAFRLLYRDLQPRLLRYLRALVGPEAEDVAADAWLQISARSAATTTGSAAGRPRSPGTAPWTTCGGSAAGRTAASASRTSPTWWAGTIRSGTRWSASPPTRRSP